MQGILQEITELTDWDGGGGQNSVASVSPVRFGWWALTAGRKRIFLKQEILFRNSSSSG
jgi:hypothetical protein